MGLSVLVPLSVALLAWGRGFLSGKSGIPYIVTWEGGCGGRMFTRCCGHAR